MKLKYFLILPEISFETYTSQCFDKQAINTSKIKC